MERWTRYILTSCASLSLGCPQQYSPVCITQPGWVDPHSPDFSEAVEQHKLSGGCCMCNLAHRCWEELLCYGRKKQMESKNPPGTGAPASFRALPSAARLLACLCLKAAVPVTSSFASTGLQNEKGFSCACLLHTSGTDMDVILQAVAHAALPLEDFSKTRLPTADLQHFLEQRGDSREATNYVDEEPDSK